MSTPKSIMIDDQLYVPADSKNSQAELGEYSIIRGDKFGVFMARVVDDSKAPLEIKVEDARRLWYWDGAASISQLAITGVSKPSNCKFPKSVQKATLYNVCEIIPCTVEAMSSISNVKEWIS